MPTPLTTVRDLNYDHHRRMTALHLQRVADGVAPGVARADEMS